MAAKKYDFCLNSGAVVKVEAKEGVIMEITCKGSFVDGRPPFDPIKKMKIAKKK